MATAGSPSAGAQDGGRQWRQRRDRRHRFSHQLWHGLHLPARSPTASSRNRSAVAAAMAVSRSARVFPTKATATIDSVGGDGGSGNTAGQVSVTASATAGSSHAGYSVMTQGDNSVGILAQSIGGGGGEGGFSIAASLSAGGDANGSTIGGSGGTGGDSLNGCTLGAADAPPPARAMCRPLPSPTPAASRPPGATPAPSRRNRSAAAAATAASRSASPARPRTTARQTCRPSAAMAARPATAPTSS